MRDSKRPIWQLIAGIVIVVLVITTIALTRPSPVLGDSDLTAEVAEVFGISRTELQALHDLAHVRAVEISTDFTHNGMRGADAEVLALNGGSYERAVQQWLGSAPHAAILSNPDYGSIGCGSHALADATFYVCLLNRGGVTTAPVPTPAPPVSIPSPPAVPPVGSGPGVIPAPSSGGSASGPAHPTPTPTPFMLPDAAMPRGDDG